MLRVVLLGAVLMAPRPSAATDLLGASTALPAAPLVTATATASVTPLRAPVRCAGRYDAPVDAPVVDPFRLPGGPYRAGNRGLEYGTDPGTAVRAIGPGEVLFAGRIAGTWHVTVRHADGLRSSYAFLAEVTVGEGDVVDAGDPLGSTGSRFLHLGVRDPTGYVDPAPLLGGRARAWLIPLRRFGDGGGCRRTGTTAAAARSVAGSTTR